MSVLDLDDAKAHLTLTGDSSVDDAYLSSVIDSAEAMISARIGPLASTTYTERVRGGGSGLVLKHSPAIALTSVTPVNGSALPLSDLYLDTDAAVITYTYGYSFYSIAYDVVYSAGRSNVPDDLLLAIKEMVRHLWQPKRGVMQRGNDGGFEAGPGYMFPNRVLELLAPYDTPGFA